MSELTPQPTAVPTPLWRRSRRTAARSGTRLNAELAIGTTLLAAIVLLALAAPLVTTHAPASQDLQHTLAGPGAGHLLGTDQLGRDIWSRVVYGARADLGIAALAVTLSFCLGSLLGTLAGYFGGWADTLVMRVVDIVVAFPFYVLIIAIVFALGAGISSIVIAIATVGWSSYARIVRGQILALKHQDFVAAARLAGFSSWRIMFRHVLPNVVSQAIVYAMSDVILVILAIVTLGYLGLGVPPPTPDWGAMIYDGQALLSTHWQVSTFPGVAIILTALSLSLIGDGLADRLRPS